jgi:hypothetical protein
MGCLIAASGEPVEAPRDGSEAARVYLEHEVEQGPGPLPCPAPRSNRRRAYGGIRNYEASSSSCRANLGLKTTSTASFGVRFAPFTPFIPPAWSALDVADA